MLDIYIQNTSVEVLHTWDFKVFLSLIIQLLNSSLAFPRGLLGLFVLVRMLLEEFLWIDIELMKVIGKVTPGRKSV